MVQLKKTLVHDHKQLYIMHNIASLKFKMILWIQKLNNTCCDLLFVASPKLGQFEISASSDALIWEEKETLILRNTEPTLTDTVKKCKQSVAATVLMKRGFSYKVNKIGTHVVFYRIDKFLPVDNIKLTVTNINSRKALNLQWENL